LTSYVESHAFAWELGMAALTIVYVVLAFLQDQGAGPAVATAVLVLAGLFVVELARLYDAPSRLLYIRRHWLDLITCIPVVGSLRALRLVRLLAFLRLGAAVRAFGVGVAASERVRGGSMLWILGPVLLLVWITASYGFYELESGINPHIQTFNDALYFSFITASTVGYGDVTPVTPAGKVLSGILIFVGIGLLGFASAHITSRLLRQTDDIGDLRSMIEQQNRLIAELSAQVQALSSNLGNAASRQVEPERLQPASTAPD